MLKKLSISLLATSLLAIVVIMSSTMTTAGRGSRFGETFAATALGSGIGSTIGTALGNAISNPRPCPPRREVIKEVVVKEVHVPTVVPARRVRQLEKEEQCLRGDLVELKSRKQSLERRISALEQELNEIEATIEVKVQALRAVEAKKKELCEPAPAPVKLKVERELGEFEV
jgi:hypothetical protein